MHNPYSYADLLEEAIHGYLDRIDAEKDKKIKDWLKARLEELIK